MGRPHPEYNEYATCTVCWLKKYCKQVNRYFICYACDNGNFNGLKKIKKDNRQ